MSPSTYTPPSFGQPGVSISYQPKPLFSDPLSLPLSLSCLPLSLPSPSSSSSPCPLLTVTVPPASIHHIFAHRQWRAGMLLSDALVSGVFDISDRNVLELGAGTALPAITAAHLGTAKMVVASDYDEPTLVAQLKANVQANLPYKNPKHIKVAGHIWGKNVEELIDLLLPDSNGSCKFDTILLADCMWDPLSHADLLSTIVDSLAKTDNARVHVIAGLHTGREKITSFIRRAYRAGLVLAPIDPSPSSISWPPQLSDTPASADTVVQENTNMPNLKDSHDDDDDDDPLRLAASRIMELQVTGNRPVASLEEQQQHQHREDQIDVPRLTGKRRQFRTSGYGDDEDEVQKRNQWLTLWSLKWRNP